MSCFKKCIFEVLGCVFSLVKASQFLWKAYANHQPSPAVAESRKANRKRKQQ